MESDGEEEERLLGEFQSLTSYTMSSDAARALLDRHAFDLTSAVNAHFESSPADENAPDHEYPPTSSRGTSSNHWLARVLGRVLLLPVSLLSTILSLPFTLLRVLRRPNPFLSAPPLSATAASERWKQSMITGAEAGNNSTGGGDCWHVGKYEDILRLAKEKKRVMMTVLTCDQHESDDAFRTVLRDGELQDMLQANDVVCWGGDVKHRDAYLVSSTVQNYAFPCIALTSLTSSSPNSMIVLSRIEGEQCLSPHSIQTTLANILSRVEPFLARERHAAEQRVLDRIRREQDERKLEETARKDAERILAMREQERKRKEEHERQARRSLEKEQKKRESQLAKLSDAKWRAAMKRHLARNHPEPSSSPSSSSTSTTARARISVRVGDGRRLVRSFSPQDPLHIVYAWVESERVAITEPTSEAAHDKVDPFDKDYKFKLVAAYPRKVYELANGTTIEEAGLVPDANLVVEAFDSTDSDSDSGSETDSEKGE